MTEPGYVEAMKVEAHRKIARDWFLRVVAVLILVGVGMAAFYTWRVTHILSIGLSDTVTALQVVNDNIVIVAETVENADTVAEKELICTSDGGEISWNTRGNKVCDVEPFARDTGSKFDFDNGDWIIV